MALKPDRNEESTDISFFMNAVMERGGVCTYRTAGSGAAMDQAEASVYPTGSTASGTSPAGILLCDMVNKDLSQTHLNWHKDEVQLGGKVTLLRRGIVTSNVIRSTAVPAVGAPVYYNPGTHGSYTNTFMLDSTGVVGTDGRVSGVQRVPPVGTWLSTKDEDGYAKVYINIAPQASLSKKFA